MGGKSPHAFSGPYGNSGNVVPTCMLWALSKNHQRPTCQVVDNFEYSKLKALTTAKGQQNQLNAVFQLTWFL